MAIDKSISRNENTTNNTDPTITTGGMSPAQGQGHREPTLCTGKAEGISDLVYQAIVNFDWTNHSKSSTPPSSVTAATHQCDSQPRCYSVRIGVSILSGSTKSLALEGRMYGWMRRTIDKVRGYILGSITDICQLWNGESWALYHSPIASTILRCADVKLRSGGDGISYRDLVSESKELYKGGKYSLRITFPGIFSSVHQANVLAT